MKLFHFYPATRGFVPEAFCPPGIFIVQVVRKIFQVFKDTIKLKKGSVTSSEIASAVFLKILSIKLKIGSSIQPKTTEVYATK